MEQKQYIEQSSQEMVQFSKVFRRILNLGIFVTGIHFFTLIIFVLFGLNQVGWMERPTNTLVKVLYLLSISICFIGFLVIKRHKKPFSNLFSKLLISIGSLWALCSLVIGHLPDYQGSFQIFSSGRGALIDGSCLSISSIILIFGFLIKYGFQYQSNDDDTV